MYRLTVKRESHLLGCRVKYEVFASEEEFAFSPDRCVSFSVKNGRSVYMDVDEKFSHIMVRANSPMQYSYSNELIVSPQAEALDVTITTESDLMKGLTLTITGKQRLRQEG